VTAMHADGAAPAGVGGATEAEELEHLLGDPAEPSNPFGFAAAVVRDEQDAFPDELASALRDAGFHLCYLPPEWGGRFASFDRSLALVRTAARRDLNVMPATMFSITAATCLQLHGSAEQQRRAAELLRDGGAIGFALSEADHGSDLLSNTTRLRPDGDGGWSLCGQKWMVGLGHRCELAYVVARTGDRGPGAFTAVLVDLRQAPAGRMDRGPEARTSGMRGIDFAHLRFMDLPVSPAELVGRPGQALEVSVKAQQVVRVMSMAGSLGCADTALRLTLDFAAGRKVGRTPLAEAPYPRRELAVAAAALLSADVVALAAARGIHVVPEVFSVWGCSAKHVVAEAADDLMRRCGSVLATRSVLRSEGPGGGLFQKLQRDAAIVRVVDTSTVANLRSFAAQLPALTAARSGGGPPAAAPAAGGSRAPRDEADVLAAVFALDRPLPPYRPDLLDLTARGRDPVTAGLPCVAAAVREELAGHGAESTARLLDRLATALAALHDEVSAAAGAEAARGTALVDLAERFAWLHAAACCVHLWYAGRDRSFFGCVPGSPGWLGACLGYLLARADGIDPRRAADVLLPAVEVIAGLYGEGRSFSAVPIQMAGGPAVTGP